MKPLRWVGSAHRDLLAMPGEVVNDMGYALYLAQIQLRHPHAKNLAGFGSGGILEVVEDFDGDTYRAVYTVRFEEAVYVLHCFQKKSKRGIATPRQDLERIRHRLQWVVAQRRGA